MATLSACDAANLAGGAVGNVTAAVVVVVIGLLVAAVARLALVVGVLLLGSRASKGDPSRADQTIRAMEVLARCLEAVGGPLHLWRGPPSS